MNSTNCSVFNIQTNLFYRFIFSIANRIVCVHFDLIRVPISLETNSLTHYVVTIFLRKIIFTMFWSLGIRFPCVVMFQPLKRFDVCKLYITNFCLETTSLWCNFPFEDVACLFVLPLFFQFLLPDNCLYFHIDSQCESCLLETFSMFFFCVVNFMFISCEQKWNFELSCWDYGWKYMISCLRKIIYLF